MELVAVLVFTIVSGLLVTLYIKRITSTFVLDDELSQYFRTSGLATNNHVKVSDIVDHFEQKYGSRSAVHLKDNSVTYPDLYVYSKCKELIEHGVNFELHIDDDLINLNLSTKHKTVPEPIDVSNYAENAGGHNRPHIQKVIISASKSFITINGLDIGDIVVAESFKGILFISNSRVKVLRLETSQQAYLPSINIDNTWLGTLQVSPNSCKEFKVSSGGICLIYTHNVPIKGSSNQHYFTGNVIFEKNPPLQCSGTSGSPDIQSYRNIVHQLNNQGNIDSEKYVQAFVKRLERPKQQPFVRLISFLYDMTSFYGSTPGRALLWLTALTMLSALSIFLSDANTLSTMCTDAKLWQSSLCSDNTSSELIRAIFMSVESVVKPFNLLTTKSVVTTDSLGVVLWLALQSVLSLTLIAIIIIGVRRKFIS